MFQELISGASLGVKIDQYYGIDKSSNGYILQVTCGECTDLQPSLDVGKD
jgi:hypothetical protein